MEDIVHSKVAVYCRLLFVVSIIAIRVSCWGFGRYWIRPGSHNLGGSSSSSFYSIGGGLGGRVVKRILMLFLVRNRQHQTSGIRNFCVFLKAFPRNAKSDVLVNIRSSIWGGYYGGGRWGGISHPPTIATPLFPTCLPISDRTGIKHHCVVVFF